MIRAMEIDEGREYLTEHRRAILATMRRDGTPQMTPVVVALDDEGRGVVSSRETAIKTKNLRRDPRCYLCVFPDSFFGGHVQLDGRAEIVSLPEAMEPLVDYYKRLAGEHPDWDDYRAAMERERRLVIRITFERAGPDRSG